MNLDRRGILLGLSAFALAPAAAAADACPTDAPTLPMVVGPFPPLPFHPLANGRPNPGARSAVSEHDLDLAKVVGTSVAPVGQVVRVRGRVLSRACRPVPGARVLLWQADHGGHYDHHNDREAPLDPGFGYSGEGVADAEGRFEVRTIVPGAYPAARGWDRPPHLHWTVRAAGLPEVSTQTFFDGDVLADVAAIRRLNEADLILNLRDGFEGALSGPALDAARKRARAEQVVVFRADAVEPTGDLTLFL